MQKRWVQTSQCDKEQAKVLASSLGIAPSLATILSNRGVCNFEEAREFFRPSLNALHDPFLMKDMDKAIARITAALQNQEKILIYGDYDVDGTTAVTVVYSFFKELTEHIEHYVPDRHKEGYGISTIGID
ncbi:MAG: single-stranded-DNA-specific exonuclease RecJ, partial [Pedobacter sp.]